jgi:RimJ/RimL family protein N-acetyltransferase
MPIQVDLRRATTSDCERVFEWRNAEVNRLWFFDQHMLSLDEHRSWYARVLADPERELLIGQSVGLPMGVLRFDMSEATATVSIYLVPGLAGRGLGTALLRAGTDWIRKTRSEVAMLRAEVRPDNVASSRAFIAAGYIEHANVFLLQLGDPK